MTKKEVAQICVMIRKATNAWRNESPDDFEETINVWYECLKAEPFEMAQKALNDYLRENQYPPTVSDIYKPYKEWLERQAELKREYNNVYYNAIAYYPCYQDTREERAEFDRITGKSVRNARTLSRQIEVFVRDREESQSCFPTLIDYLKGVKKIE